MRTEIQSKDYELTQSLERFIKMRVDQSMNSVSGYVEALTIRLRHTNSPKGGRDKECLVEVKLANRPAIVVRKRSSDAYASIRKSLGRASRVTLRCINKRRDRSASHRGRRVPDISQIPTTQIV